MNDKKHIGWRITYIVAILVLIALISILVFQSSKEYQFCLTHLGVITGNSLEKCATHCIFHKEECCVTNFWNNTWITSCIDGTTTEVPLR